MAGDDEGEQGVVAGVKRCSDVRPPLPGPVSIERGVWQRERKGTDPEYKYRIV